MDSFVAEVWGDRLAGDFADIVRAYRVGVQPESPKIRREENRRSAGHYFHQAIEQLDMVALNFEVLFGSGAV